MNSLVLGQYVKGNSYIYKLDPRVKLISLVLLIVSLFLINSLPYMGIFLGFITLIFITSKISLTRMIKGLKPVIFILIFTFLIQVVYTKDNNPPLLDLTFNFSFVSLLVIILLTLVYLILRRVIKFKTILTLIYLILIFVSQYYIKNDLLFGLKYNLTLYETALERSIFILIRILSVISLSSLLTFTTMPLEIKNGLESILSPLKVIHVPVEEIAMMISITLRFIPTLYDETQKIIKAQASRGVDFSEGSLKQKITQVISLLVPMFVISFNRAEDLADAMEARGYVIGSERSRFDEMKYKPMDYICYIVIFLVLGLAILGRVL